MIRNHSTHSLALVASIALPVLSWAGTVEKAKAAEPAPVASSITGNLGLNFDSRFVSFGQDTWGPSHQPLFHPSLELTKAVTEEFKLILGTWWDVNDQVTSSIGNRIQEVDVWFGGSYTTGALTTTALYQNWMYGGKNEQALELKFAVDTFLKPSLLIHQRLPTGYEGGTVVVLGAAYDFKAGPVSFSVPAAVSFTTADYWTKGDSGIGFGSLGLTASVPTEFVAKGASFSVGVTGYVTNDDVITYNKGAKMNSNFVNLNAGINIPF
jgi:hypothetical protein